MRYPPLLVAGLLLCAGCGEAPCKHPLRDQPTEAVDLPADDTQIEPLGARQGSAIEDDRDAWREDGLPIGRGVAASADQPAGSDRAARGVGAADFAPVSAAARLESAAAFPTLAAMALGDPDPRVRGEAVRALGELREAALIPPLQQALLDPVDQVRRAAMESLAAVGGPNAAQALSLVLSDADSRARLDAVVALGDLGGPAAIRALEQATADPDSLVREAAAAYLSELN